MLRVNGRYYRTIPITCPGYDYEDIALDESRTALLAMHCWNIGCEDGPKIDDEFWVGMGFPVVYEEADRIMRERILPAMDAARGAGVLVCHVESETIRSNRSRSTDPPPLHRAPPEPTGWRERIAWRSHGVDYGNRSPLSKMDRAGIVSPMEGEPFLYTTEELDQVLTEKGVENLLYSGFATDMCILRAPGGIESMAPRGYKIFLLRDATVGVESPDTYDQRIATRWAIRYFETHLGDTLATDDFISACLRSSGS
jgi:nicotinamidase-related amidase